MTRPDPPAFFSNPLDPDVYGAGDPADGGLPLDTYAWLRAESPCHRQHLDDSKLVPWTWVVSRHEHVSAIARSDAFSTEEGVNLRRFEMGIKRRGGKPTMLLLDGEAHLANRRVVGRGFSPAAVRSFEQRFRGICAEVLQRSLARGTFDFVDEVAMELPVRAICELIGVPESERGDITRWIHATVAFSDPEVAVDYRESIESLHNLWAYAVRLAERKRVTPAADLFSRVAVEDGFSDDEIMGMLMVLAGAGNETIRNAASHGVLALLTQPDAMATLRADSDGAVLDCAVEEVLRWASPVIGTGRLAVAPFEVAGTIIEPGEWVWLLLASANFDETVFGDPRRFDVTREPNPHVAFNPGTHACLGASVARLEIRILLEELLARTKQIRLAGEPAYLRDRFLRGVKHLPVVVET